MIAARALGVGNLTIMSRHLLPNGMTPVITFLPFRMSGAILALTSLDFLMRIAGSLEVGDSVEVEYFREGKLATMQITLPERPAQPDDIPD